MSMKKITKAKLETDIIMDVRRGDIGVIKARKYLRLLRRAKTQKQILKINDMARGKH